MIPLLADVRVLELSSVVMGPFAGQILADLGARVIKVEPIEGDVARAAPPAAVGMSALYANNNRNKKAIALNLKTPQGWKVLERMIRRCDVLLHNMRADAAERLGVDFASASAINPLLIHCAAIGFGQRGRYRGRPAFDDVIQAAAGLAALGNGGGDEPRFVPTILADKVAALYAVYGILAGLVARAHGRTEALRVEVPMFETLASFILNEHLAGATFDEDGRVGYARVLARDRRPYRSRDGWLAVLPYTVEQWRRFLTEIGRSDMLAQEWFQRAETRNARIDELYGVIAAALAERDTASWLETLTRLDIPCAQVNSLEDLLHDPHLHDVSFFAVGERYPRAIRRMLPQPVTFDGIASEEDAPPPALGADTFEVLADFGYSDGEIKELIAQRVALAAAGT